VKLTGSVVAAINGASGVAEVATLAAGKPNPEVTAWDCDAEPGAPLELSPVTGPEGCDTAGAGNCAVRLRACGPCCCCALRGGEANEGGG
jgi:hypothetical protein